MPLVNPPVTGIRERYSKLHTLDEYTRYIDSQIDAAKQSGQLKDDPVNREVTIITMHGNLKLGQYLRKLKYTDKVKLIHALVMNDMDTFTDMLVPALQEDIVAGNISIDGIKAINSLTPDQLGIVEKQWLTPLTRWIIRCVLKDDIGMPLDQNDAGIIVGSAFSQIPDTTISVHAKTKICHNIEFFSPMPRVQYIESVEPLKKARDTGEISIKEFKKITKNGMIDKGEYILICLGLLKPFTQTSDYIQRLVDDVRRFYVYANYDEAIALLTEIVKTKLLKKNERSQLILKASSSLIPADKGKQYSRRFFENRLAALAQKKSLDPDVIKRISATYLRAEFTNIENPIDMVKLIAVLGEADLPYLFDRSREIRSRSKYWDERGRIDKGDVLTRHEELEGHVGSSIFTQNKGIMRSIQPNYRDELTTNAVRNSSSDTTSFDRRRSYVSDNPDTVFVTGFSGHAMFFVAVLEDYMKRNKSSPTLEFDVNEFIKAVVITNISYGFHSMMEVLDVFVEPKVLKIFEKYKVELFLDWSEDLLDGAFADAQTYAKSQLLHQAATREVEKYHSLYNAIVKNDFKRVALLLEKHQRQGKKVKKTKDDFGRSVYILTVAVERKVSKEILHEILKYHPDVDRFDLARACIENDYLDGLHVLAEMGYEFGVSELKYAIKRDNLEIAQYLVEEQNVSVATLDGRIRSELFNAHRSQAMYEFLMSKGEDYNRGNELHRIIASSRSREDKCHAITKILEQTPKKLVELNVGGETPLQQELAKTPPDSVIILTILNHKKFTPVVLDMVDPRGDTPLMRAIVNNSPVEVIHALIKAGADLTIKNNDKQTIIDLLSRIHITKELQPSARLIIAEVAKVNPKLLEKYTDEKTSSLARMVRLDNKRFHKIVEDVMHDRKDKSRHGKKDVARVGGHPSAMFSESRHNLTKEEFTAAMWQVKVSMVNMNKSENIGTISFQTDVMALFELVDSLGRGKTPRGWEDRIDVLLSTIESYIKRHPAEPRPQLQRVIEQSRKNIAEFNKESGVRPDMK